MNLSSLLNLLMQNDMVDKYLLSRLEKAVETGNSNEALEIIWLVKQGGNLPTIIVDVIDEVLRSR